jgi:hypothetical protein
MTTIAPVNQRGSAIAVRKDGDWPDHIPAGLWSFYTRGDNARAGILFGCPCGCGQMMSIAFHGAGGGPQWNWDGNDDRPTTTPSILIYQLEEGTGRRVGEHWHGYLTHGEFRSC